MANNIDLMLEAEKRGILPEDKVALLTEARKRGLVPRTQTSQGQQRENYNLAQVPIEAAKSIIPDTGRVLSGLAQTVLHPIDTATGITKVAAGGVEKLIPTSLLPAGRTNEPYFDAAKQMYKDKYGGYENIKRTMAEEPVSALADIASIFTGGGAALKTGNLAKAGQVASKIGVAIDPIQAIGKVAGLGAKGAGKVAAFGTSLATGKSSDTIREIYNAAKEGGDVKAAMLKGLRNESSQADTADSLRWAFQNLKDKRGLDYGNKLKTIEQSSGGIKLDTAPIDDAVNNTLARFRVNSVTKNPETGAWTFEGLSTLNAADKAEFGKMLDIIDEWKNHPEGNTVLGLDSLKQQLDGFYTPNSRIGAVSTGLKNSVRKILEEKVPGYKDMTSGYSQASDMLNQLNSSLSLGNKKSTNAIIQKIGTTMREDSTFRRDLVQSMDSLLGENNYAKMAGTMMSSGLPTGLVGRSMGAGELGALATGNFMPGLLPLMAAGSPRIVGESANILGTLARLAEKAKPLTKSNVVLPAYQAGNLQRYLEKKR